MTAPDPALPPSASPAAPIPWRLGPLLLVATLVGGLLFWQFRAAEPPRDPLTAASRRAASAAAPVSLVVDRGFGPPRQFAPINWQPEMTVADVLAAAEKQSADFNFQAQGAGPTAFVHEMAGVKNGAGRVEASYWLLFVNDQAARQSYAITPVAAGDRILWKYAKLE